MANVLTVRNDRVLTNEAIIILTTALGVHFFTTEMSEYFCTNLTNGSDFTVSIFNKIYFPGTTCT